MSEERSLDPYLEPGGFADLVGYRLVEWEPDRAVLKLPLEERHLNRSGRMHGGVLTTLIDAACGYAGTHCAVTGRTRRALTLQLSTQFMEAGRLGDCLLITGQKTGGGQTVFFAEAEVRRSDGTLVGRGEGVFRYRRGSASPNGVPAEIFTNRRG